MEIDDHVPAEPPLTPKIQVVSPPDELSEDEIQYIGVGLGTLSTQDKKRRGVPTRAATEPPPTVEHRASSESLRSNASITSGQLTPAEPMVYESPVITHENVFENAFQRAEDKIRLTEGEHTRLYNTWRSEELRGQPVSNRYGREKVELKRIDDNDDERPRWEKVLEEKLPLKLTEIYLRKDWKGKLREGAAKLLGDSTLHKIENIGSRKENEPEATEDSEERKVSGSVLSSPTSTRKGWQGLLGNTAQKQLGAAKSAMDSLKETITTHEESDSSKNQGN